MASSIAFKNHNHMEKKGSCGSIWSKVSRGTHRASGVANLTTLLSLGTSIPLLCVTPCRSLCYQEDHSPVSVLALHYFQNNFSHMSSCWLIWKHQQRQENSLCWRWIESWNMQYMQFTQKNTEKHLQTLLHPLKTAAAIMYKPNLCTFWTQDCTMAVNSFAALQFYMWITICSFMERNTISCAPGQCRGLGMCCFLHWYQHSQYQRPDKIIKPSADEVIVSARKWVTVCSGHTVRAHSHK